MIYDLQDATIRLIGMGLVVVVIAAGEWAHLRRLEKHGVDE